MTTIRIICAHNGQPTDFDGQYVMVYDPTYHPEGEEYDGGILEVTPNLAEARQFGDLVEAAEYWRQSYGLRPDGEPNRPLTAFHVEIG